MYDQNQQYKEGLQIGEYINVTFGGDHAGTGTVFALPPTNLSGGKDESFKYNVPTLIAGSQKKAGLLGGSGTLPPAVSEILNQEDAIIVLSASKRTATKQKCGRTSLTGLTHC